MGTFRLPWRNGSERAKVLDEKHKKGMVARQERALRRERRTSGRGMVVRQERALRRERRTSSRGMVVRQERAPRKERRTSSRGIEARHC
ncbi:hypothetical protein Drorol1_Dr00004683 [Drosera rotundifolia]